MLLSGMTAYSQISGTVSVCNEPAVVTFIPVELSFSNGQILKTATDDLGYFRFYGSGVDTFRIVVKSPYYSALDSVFLISKWNGGEIQLCVSPVGLTLQSEELVVKGSRVVDDPLSYKHNEYKVLPGSFQDPSRILLRSPGFTTDNDGANGIVFRGMPPEMHRWQLFGADIVNPNHLPNAGTANDLATSHAGGVNAFSGSVLGNYHFERNPASISYADVGSGTSSLSMADSLHPFIDLNLIGVEAGMGATIGKRKLYASYRYSFVGLLEKLGVGFGNERIGYEDVAFYADLLRNRKSKLRVFGLSGSSYNIHDPVNSSNEELQSFKDMQSITFRNTLSVFGIDHLFHTGRRGIFTNTLVWSSRNTTRHEESDSLWMVKTGFQRTSYHLSGEKMLSLHSRYDYSNLQGFRMQVGMRFSITDRQWQSQLVTPDSLINQTFYPYSQVSGDQLLFTVPIRWTGGLAIRADKHVDLRIGVEPYLQFETRLTSPSKIQLRYRMATTPNFADPLSVSMTGLGGIRGNHFQIQYTYSGEGYLAGSNLFTHVFSKMPVYKIDDQSQAIFHLANGASGGYDFIQAPAKIQTSGVSPFVSYGCEVFGQVTSKNWRMEGNISILNASFRRGDGGDEWLSSRYSVGRIANLVVLYQLERKHKETNRIFMMGTAIHYRGGYLRQQLADVNNSDVVGVYRPESAYIFPLNDYMRVDFRFVYKRSGTKKGVVHRWSLDIQNLLNRQNDGFFYADPIFKAVYLQKQLGLIPVLSYRLEFPVLSIP